MNNLQLQHHIFILAYFVIIIINFFTILVVSILFYFNSVSLYAFIYLLLSNINARIEYRAKNADIF